MFLRYLFMCMPFLKQNTLHLCQSIEHEHQSHDGWWDEPIPLSCCRFDRINGVVSLGWVCCPPLCCLLLAILSVWVFRLYVRSLSLSVVFVFLCWSRSIWSHQNCVCNYFLFFNEKRGKVRSLKKLSSINASKMILVSFLNYRWHISIRTSFTPLKLHLSAPLNLKHSDASFSWIRFMFLSFSLWLEW